MKAVFYILLGWILTTTTVWALGTVLLRRLRLQLHRSEEILLGFVTGAAILSALIFTLCTLHIVYKGVLIAIALAAFALVSRSLACTPPEDRLAVVPRTWKVVFALVFAVFSFLYFFNALAPETGPDSSGYHLPVLARYYGAHGFVRIPWDMYANLSQGVELLFLMAFAFGHNSAAAMVHFSFLLTLPWLMLSYARRFGFPSAGAAAALMVFVSPVIGRDGSTAYIDLVPACVVFAMYYFLQLWDRQCNPRLLIPVGILAGFAFAAKYIGIVAVPYAILFVAWKSWRRQMPVLRPTLLIASLALVMMAPWPLKNWIFVGNPVAPLANGVFPNPNFHVSTEQEWLSFLKSFDMSRKEIPWEITVSGERLHGIYGPMFLLAPVALGALYYSVGRQLLLAAAVFGGLYFNDIEVRFLINTLPFVSLALALVLQNLRGLLLVITLTHAILSWPSVLSMYSSPYAWHLRTIPIGAALRNPDDDTYLSHNWSPYLIDRMLEKQLSPNDKVFSFTGIAESYTSRQVLVSYLAAPNEVLGDILLTAIVKDFQPNKVTDFQFPERTFQRIRVVQTARHGADQWEVAEIRVFDRDRELPRNSQWRLRAQPNPWDVQLAFDNAVVTRWRSWQPAEPGMYIEIDSGASHLIDNVRVETRDGTGVQMRLEGLDPSGRWALLSDQPAVHLRSIDTSLRRSATEELKARGVRFVLVDSSSYGATDFSRYPAYWGLKEVGLSGGTRLYHIE